MHFAASSGAALALIQLPGPAAERPFGILVADRILRLGPAPDFRRSRSRDRSPLRRLPIGNVQRNPQRSPWALHVDRSGRRDVNASHFHFRFTGFETGCKGSGDQSRAGQLLPGAPDAFVQSILSRRYRRARLPACGIHRTFLNRLPNMTGDRRRPYRPFGILVADRILRLGPAPDSAVHAHAIARLCARGPIGNVQRNPQRSPWALPSLQILPHF
ncbi:Uncharacterised protein [Burkholderia pseudomallei]|nr:Uncharacterised protein [Burkholderia pseudomallei]